MITEMSLWPREASRLKLALPSSSFNSSFSGIGSMLFCVVSVPYGHEAYPPSQLRPALKIGRKSYVVQQTCSASTFFMISLICRSRSYASPLSSLSNDTYDSLFPVPPLLPRVSLIFPGNEPFDSPTRTFASDLEAWFVDCVFRFLLPLTVRDLSCPYSGSRVGMIGPRRSLSLSVIHPVPRGAGWSFPKGLVIGFSFLLAWGRPAVSFRLRSPPPRV